MYSKNLKTFLKRRMAFLLSVIMIITLVPVNAFAADVAAKTVVKINTVVAATKDVEFGTAQDALGLPTKLSVQVKNADSEETTEEEAATPAPVSEPEDNQDPDAGVMPLALDEIDLKNNISSQSFKVQVAGGSYVESTELAADTKLHVGDEIWAQFKYSMK